MDRRPAEAAQGSRAAPGSVLGGRHVGFAQRYGQRQVLLLLPPQPRQPLLLGLLALPLGPGQLLLLIAKRTEVCKARGGGLGRLSCRGDKRVFSTKRVPKALLFLERVAAVSPERLERIGGLGEVCRAELAYRCTFTWKVQERGREGEREEEEEREKGETKQKRNTSYSQQAGTS